MSSIWDTLLMFWAPKGLGSSPLSSTILITHSLPHRLRPAPHQACHCPWSALRVCHLQYGRSPQAVPVSLTSPGHASRILILLHGVKPQLLSMIPSFLVFPMQLRLHLSQCLSWPLTVTGLGCFPWPLSAFKTYHLAHQVWLPAWAGLGHFYVIPSVCRTWENTPRRFNFSDVCLLLIRADFSVPATHHHLS